MHIQKRFQAILDARCPVPDARILPASESAFIHTNMYKSWYSFQLESKV